jgi:carbamoyl-phosphate synthase small subunit
MQTQHAGDSTQGAPIGRLALADGTVLTGRAFGATGRSIVATAEVVFTTAMTGYQESLTDPSYTGQILISTSPMVGNTGVNPVDVESVKVQVSGFVIRELSRVVSNYRANLDLSSYLAQYGVLGLEGVDTRALTRILRTSGSQNGVLTDRTDLTDEQLVHMARTAPSMAGQNLVPRVGCNSAQSWQETLGEWSPDAGARSRPRFRVLALDCGAKRNILRNLADRGCEVHVVPHDIKASEIQAKYANGEIDGLFISNGPGDPAAVEATIATLRQVISGDAKKTIPTFGICLGHQLLSLATGAKTYKLKFGHRGANQPILNKRTGHVEITSQNHGFAVDRASLAAAGGEETHTHLNDDTVAGFRLKDRPVMSVQYHPEASPGPHDASYLFDEFVASMAAARRHPALI